MNSPENDVAATLEQKRAELSAELDGLSAPTEDHGGISFGKRVGEGTSIAVDRLSSVAAHETLQITLSDVTRAQSKLASGSWGICDRCGKDISAARLEALPWAVQCITCASKQRRRG